jgi:hypothetical protein
MPIGLSCAAGLHQALAPLSGVAVIATFSVTEPVTMIPSICPQWMIRNSDPTASPPAGMCVGMLGATGRKPSSLGAHVVPVVEGKRREFEPGPWSARPPEPVAGLGLAWGISSELAHSVTGGAQHGAAIQGSASRASRSSRGGGRATRSHPARSGLRWSGRRCLRATQRLQVAAHGLDAAPIAQCHDLADERDGVADAGRPSRDHTQRAAPSAWHVDVRQAGSRVVRLWTTLPMPA